MTRNYTRSSRETGTGRIGILTAGRPSQEIIPVLAPVLTWKGIVIRIRVAYMHRGSSMHWIMGNRKVWLNYSAQAGDEPPGETFERLHGVTPC